jgi:hypothetical protein
MFRSIQPCPSLRFLILPAQSCRKTGQASPRIEGSNALALRCLNMLSITREAGLCLQTDLTLRSSATAAMSPSRWPRSPFRETVHRHPAAGRRTTTTARYIHSVRRSFVMRSMQSVGKVQVDAGKHNKFRSSARCRPAPTPVHKVLRRFTLARNASPGQ